MTRIQQSLIAAQELGDEKLHVVAQLQEVIDQKTRQLETDYKNLDFADKDDPGLRESPSNDGNPSSPSAYLPSTSATAQKNEPSTSTGGSTVPHEPKTNTSKATTTTSTSNATTERSAAWKRSRRARDAASRTSGNASTFGNTTKLDGDSSNSNSNQSRTNVSTTSQQSTGNTTTANRNRSGNNGNKNNAKKRKRTSGRTNNGSNGKCFVRTIIEVGCLHFVQKFPLISPFLTFPGGNNSTNAGSSNQNVSRVQAEIPPAFEETIDPDEPTYCLCDQISFGEMILCDNDLCPIEWFHFSCVSLTTKPKGKWFCPNCRGDRPSVMKPKQQFLKELERYNREKEEKS